MRRAGCSPISRSRSPTARTRSAGSACWAIGRTCSGRWRRCRRRGGCWTGSTAAILTRSARRGRRPGRRRGRPARARTWTASCVLDFDATITIAHSEKENAAATWKTTFGFHPLLCFLDRPEVAGGEALAGLLRPGQRRLEHRRRPHHGARSGVGQPCPSRPGPDPATRTGPRLLARSDSAGATHAFAAACVRAWGRVLLRIPCRLRGSSRIVDVIPDAVLASGDPDRRRPAGRGVGGRGHRHGRPVRLAGRGLG